MTGIPDAAIRVKRLVLGDLQTNCWIVDDGVGGPLLVIDPAGDADVLLAEIAGAPVAGVVLTHAHFDHLGAAEELVAASGAELMVHVSDAARITSAAPGGTGAALFGYADVAPPADRLLHEGDTIAAGAIGLQVLHTPGHTEGGICLFGHGHLFSGDTLFAGSVGRTDFPGGDARALSRSIAEKIAPLPDETVVHPGHGPDTTVGRERRVNPFFPRA